MPTSFLTNCTLLLLMTIPLELPLLTYACPNKQQSSRCMLGPQPTGRRTSTPVAFDDHPISALPPLARLAPNFCSVWQPVCLAPNYCPFGNSFDNQFDSSSGSPFRGPFGILLWPPFTPLIWVYDGWLEHYASPLPLQPLGWRSSLNSPFGSKSGIPILLYLGCLFGVQLLPVWQPIWQPCLEAHLAPCFGRFSYSFCRSMMAGWNIMQARYAHFFF